jgi:hypothetical protein
MLPEPPCVLIAADTLDELGARLKFEIDVMIDTAKEVVAGHIMIDKNGVPIRKDKEEKKEKANGPHLG